MTFHIQVLSEDFLQAIFNIQKNTKVLIMDMANGDSPGGGHYKNYNGAPSILFMGQEEKLCANSDLLSHLNQLDYPINALTSQPVCKNVKFHNDCAVDVAVCVAPKASYGEEPNIAQLQAQIHMFLESAKEYDVVLASAFGCGGFKNNPAIVSRLFKQECKRVYCEKNVELKFLIYKENYCMDNYTIFHKALHGLMLGAEKLTFNTATSQSLESLEEE